MKSADCSASLINLIKAAQIPSLMIPGTSNQKVVAVDVPEQVIDKLGSALVKRPAVAIMYEGGRATSSQQVGLPAEMVFSLYLLTEQNVIAPELTNVATETQVLLDATRKAIQGMQSPTGHKWAWVLEAPAAKKGSLLLWLQRWKTASVANPR